ncbi:MAG: hypothetical protein IH911_01095 [Proteobacteria bacterium]|nr:hypothetical protein [Pseudomonadota bacterium]
MDIQAMEIRTNRPILIGLLLLSALVITACGDDGSEYDPNCPFGCDPVDFEDHILASCPIYYRWNGLFNSWTACDDAWRPVSNQPVFTSLNDCLIAKGLLLDEDPVYWDNTQEDRDRGYALKLFCFEASLF